MTYSCDLNYVNPSFYGHTINSLLSDICKTSTELRGIPGQSLSLLKSLQDSQDKNAFIIEDGIIIFNTTLTIIDNPLHMVYKFNKPLHIAQALDNKPIDIAIILLSPVTDGPLHLRRLSRLSRMIKNPDFVARLRDADDVDSIRLQFMYPDLQAKAA